VTDSRDRYFARPADVPGCFLLWDERSNSAVYGIGLPTKDAGKALALRLNDIYRQFLKDRGSDP